MTLTWTEPHQGRQRLNLTTEAGTGHIDVGLKNADNETEPYVDIDGIYIAEPLRGTDARQLLIEEVVRHWPDRLIVGGPLNNDDDPGPRFRLRCWRDYGIPFHQMRFGGHTDCDCEEQTLQEALRRLDLWHQHGGIDAEELARRNAELIDGSPKGQARADR